VDFAGDPDADSHRHQRGNNKVCSLARLQTEYDVLPWTVEQLRNELAEFINDRIVKVLLDLSFEVCDGIYRQLAPPGRCSAGRGAWPAARTGSESQVKKHNCDPTSSHQTTYSTTVDIAQFSLRPCTRF
jgi:hypothetical protein